MPKQVVPITKLADTGVVLDTPPVSLPPNTFSDVRNVRFKDGAVRKMPGEVDLNSTGIEASDTQGNLRYLAFWPNPNRAPLGGYYVYVIDNIVSGSIVGQRVFIQDETGARKDVTPTSLPNGFSIINSESSTTWHHTLFAGGFAFIINNGVEAPHYIIDPDDNTDIVDVPLLSQLPGWESYNVNELILRDTFTDTSSNIFDTGQLRTQDSSMNFITNYVIIRVRDGVEQTLVETSDYTIAVVNGQDAITFVNNSLEPDDEVSVTFRSTNTVVVSAGAIRAFGDFLVAGNLIEYDSKDPDMIIRRLTGVVRTSDVAQPGSIPSNWNPFAAGTSTADEFVIADTGTVQDMVSLQGNMYLYTNTSISVMRLTGNPTVPLTVQPVTDQYGLLTTNAVLEYDGRHFVIGSNDLYLFGGHPGSIQSVADARTRRYFYDNINPVHERRLFTLLNQAYDEIWICYPSLASTSGESTEALIWNYRNNTWTIRDLNSVEGGAIAPVPGGGIPGTTFTINSAAQSGDARQLNLGRQEVQTLTIPSGVEGVQQQGIPTAFNLAVTGDTPVAFDAGDIEQVDVTFDSSMDGPGNLDEPPRGSGPNIREAVNTVNLSTIAVDANDNILVDDAAGTGSTILMYDTSVQSSGGQFTLNYTNTDNSPNNSNAIIDLNTIFDGVLTSPAPVTRQGLADNLARVITNNDVPELEDWTATTNTPNLVMTSEVPGARTFGSANFTGFVGQTDSINEMGLSQTTGTVTRNGIDFTVDGTNNTITATNNRTTLNDTVFGFSMSGNATQTMTNQEFEITGGSGSGQQNDALGTNNIVRGQARSGRDDGNSERRLAGRIWRIPPGQSISVNNTTYGPGTWLNAYLDQRGGAASGQRLARNDPVISFADASTLYGTNGANIEIDVTFNGSRQNNLRVQSVVDQVPIPGNTTGATMSVTRYLFIDTSGPPGASNPVTQRLNWIQTSARGHYIEGQNAGDWILHNVRIDGVTLISEEVETSTPRTLEAGESETLTFENAPTLTAYTGDVLRVAEMTISQMSSMSTVYPAALALSAQAGDDALAFGSVAAFPDMGTGYLGTDEISWTGRATSISSRIASGGHLPGASIPLVDASAFPRAGSGTISPPPNRFGSGFTWTGKSGNTLINVRWSDPFGGSSISTGRTLSARGQSLTGVTGITETWGAGSGIGEAVPINSSVNVIETAVNAFAIAVIGQSDLSNGGTFTMAANTPYEVITRGFDFVIIMLQCTRFLMEQE